MTKSFPSAAAALALLAAAGVALADPAPALKGQALAGQAKVTLAQARAIALKARPGEITDQELEREGGGSGLRYSFDVRSAGVVYEVGVDAKTGKVLENSREGAHPD
jgi:uncharacterized membrane protein YkoI